MRSEAAAGERSGHVRGSARPVELVLSRQRTRLYTRLREPSLLVSGEMRQFIDAVRMQTCIWNPQHPMYRDSVVKDEAWQNVVDEIKMPHIKNIQIAKLEWKKLRDNHRDALKRAKLGKNKLLPAQITTWKYAKAMQFLEPHMKYRITEHIETEHSSSYQTDQDVSTTETAVTHTATSERPLTKKRRTENSSDALEAFFNSMLQSTREMPSWMQTQVKKRLFAVIIEAEEEINVQRLQDSEGYPDDEDPMPVEVKTELITDDD